MAADGRLFSTKRLPGMTMLPRATPERLSAFSDGVFAVLITVLVLELRPPELPTFEALLSLWPTWLSYAELPIHRHCLDQSPLSHALRHRGEPSSIMVQFCASIFHVASAAFYRLDGEQRVSAATCCLLCSGFLPRERHLHMLDLGAH
jgi:transmembrane protein TMEM174 (potassium channel)